MASLIADKFSVVTTLSRSIVPIEHNLSKYGLMARCARVRAAEVPVLALEDRRLADARRPSSRRSSARSPRTARRRSCSAAPA